MSVKTYIHGVEPGEQGRLGLLNRLTNKPFVEFLGVRPGMKVVEVGSGLGILAAEVASAAQGANVVGVEQSPEQIKAATKHAAVRYVLGDAHRLDFEDGAFDLVYARYLLEHVGRPEAVVQEMARVTRTGGRVAACENDVSLIRFDPPCPAFETVWQAFQAHQQQLGGDSRIGRRLYRLFRQAGLTKIELSVQPEVHWHGSPGFAAWVENIIGNVESGRAGLITAGLSSQSKIDAGVAELSALSTNPDASSCFIWNRAIAVKS
jgi:SAM-dependent methyltransferase